MNEETSAGDFLPTDLELCERAKEWSNVFHKYKEKNEDENLSLGIHESIEFDFVDVPVELEEESVDPSEFEGDTSEESDNFNVEEVLNQTKQIIQMRKESWSRSGIDRLMDTFTCDNITDKVDGWLKHNCDYFSSHFIRNSGKNNCGEMKINHQNIILEKEIEAYSHDSSVDTAKYILSNRKRRKSNVRMTIKQFCFSAHKSVNDMLYPPKKKISGNDSIRKALTMGRSNHNNIRSQKQYTTSSPPKRHKYSKYRHHSRSSSFSSSSSLSDRVQKTSKKVKKHKRPSRKTMCTANGLKKCTSNHEEVIRSQKCRRSSQDQQKKSIISKLSPKSSCEIIELSGSSSRSSKECSSDQSITSLLAKKHKFHATKYKKFVISSSSSMSDSIPEIVESNEKSRKKVLKQCMSRKSVGCNVGSDRCIDNEIIRPQRWPRSCKDTQKPSLRNNSPAKKLSKSKKLSKNQSCLSTDHNSDRSLVPSSQNILASNHNSVKRRNTDTNLKPISELPNSWPELNSTHNGVINSTALKSQDSMIRFKENFESICKNVNDQEDANRKSIQNNTINSCNTNTSLVSRNSSNRILLYSPHATPRPKRLSEAGKIVITESDLEENLGSQLKNQYLGNQQQFHYECNANSKLIFVPPHNVTSSDSEDDPLEKMGRTQKGEIIEIMQLSSAKRD